MGSRVPKRALWFPPCPSWLANNVENMGTLARCHTAGGALGPEIWESDPVPCFPPHTVVHISPFLSLHPQGKNHHPLPSPPPILCSPPACNATLFSPGCALINRAFTAPPNWFVISDPSLCVDHGPVLRCALRPWTSAEVSKNAKTAEKDKKREGGRKGYRQTDRERERQRYASVLLQHSTGLGAFGRTDVITPTVWALIGILSTQLLVCYTLSFFISIPSFGKTCRCRFAAARIN